MKRASMILALCLMGQGGTALAGEGTNPMTVPHPPVTIAGGYLSPANLPDSIMLLPPAPAPHSAVERRDKEASKAGQALQGSARWELAQFDADLFSPVATTAFSCAAGIEISKSTTPATFKLLRRMALDMAMTTMAAKRQFARARPFMVNGKPSCTPKDEPMLRKDGSYPSGHSAIGYGWGLMLAELVPARASQLVTRGTAFGDSRRVCNVHWLFDVEQGRMSAAATFARLHADPAFRADVEAARAELAGIEASGTAPAPSRDCAKEAAALAEVATPPSR